MPVPVGAVTVIVPVAIMQVGWVKVTVGAAGEAGEALIVTLFTEEMQPSEFFAVTVYVPGDTSVNMPVVLVYVEPLIL
jgi:hypothetical protein